VIRLEPGRIADALGAQIVRRGEGGYPERAATDSRAVAAGELFFGLRGESSDGGEFAGQAFQNGAWGVVVDPGWAAALDRAAAPGWVFAADDPLAAMQSLARAWRRRVGCPVVGITGSTGKTSVKDICRALLPGRVHASPENYNTEVGLPLAVHLGGQGGINANPTGTGPPTFFWEAHALLCETGMGHVASAIAHGVFARWPGTRLVLIECGVAWLPAVLWRLDADYRALRKETPWLKRLPSEYARDHVRLTTQPLEQPRDPGSLWPALEDIGAQDMLLFASDYPHWDFDDPRLVPIPRDWREDVMDGNARALYGL
jgi:hypothetical protein